jgi:hypothetical protein
MKEISIKPFNDSSRRMSFDTKTLRIEKFWHGI